jgi:hypothetical protein
VVSLIVPEPQVPSIVRGVAVAQVAPCPKVSVEINKKRKLKNKCVFVKG